MQSPCIGRCDPNSPICPGCGRSDREICDWMFYTDEERSQIMQRLKQQGYGKKDPEETEDPQQNSVFGRKGKEWKLPPINEV